jgi:hypothetical protein
LKRKTLGKRPAATGTCAKMRNFIGIRRRRNRDKGCSEEWVTFQKKGGGEIIIKNILVEKYSG